MGSGWSVVPAPAEEEDEAAVIASQLLVSAAAAADDVSASVLEVGCAEPEATLDGPADPDRLSEGAAEAGTELLAVVGWSVMTSELVLVTVISVVVVASVVWWGGVPQTMDGSSGGGGVCHAREEVRFAGWWVVQDEEEELGAAVELLNVGEAPVPVLDGAGVPVTGSAEEAAEDWSAGVEDSGALEVGASALVLGFAVEMGLGSVDHHPVVVYDRLGVYGPVLPRVLGPGPEELGPVPSVVLGRDEDGGRGSVELGSDDVGSALEDSGLPVSVAKPVKAGMADSDAVSEGSEEPRLVDESASELNQELGADPHEVGSAPAVELGAVPSDVVFPFAGVLLSGAVGLVLDLVAHLFDFNGVGSECVLCGPGGTVGAVVFVVSAAPELEVSVSVEDTGASVDVSDPAPVEADVSEIGSALAAALDEMGSALKVAKPDEITDEALSGPLLLVLGASVVFPLDVADKGAAVKVSENQLLCCGSGAEVGASGAELDISVTPISGEEAVVVLPRRAELDAVISIPVVPGPFTELALEEAGSGADVGVSDAVVDQYPVPLVPVVDGTPDGSDKGKVLETKDKVGSVEVSDGRSIVPSDDEDGDGLSERPV